MSSIEQVREAYFKCSQEPGSFKAYYPKPFPTEEGNGLLIGYDAAFKALQARDEFFPLSKLNYIQKAMTMFLDAAAKSPGDAEIRMLRLITQSGVPAYLNLSGNIADDWATVLDNLGQLKTKGISKTMLIKMAELIERNSIGTAEERQQLKAAIEDPLI